MMKPSVWNKRRPREIPAGAVYVGRPSPWGNPHIVGWCGVCRTTHQRGEALALFKQDLKQLDPERLAELVRPLIGKHLVCWCAPNACHADVWLALAKGENPWN